MIKFETVDQTEAYNAHYPRGNDENRYYGCLNRASAAYLVKLGNGKIEVFDLEAGVGEKYTGDSCGPAFKKLSEMFFTPSTSKYDEVNSASRKVREPHVFVRRLVTP